MEIIQIEDAIPRPYQDQVEAELTSTRTAWFFHEDSARSAKGELEASYGGFSHPTFNIKEPNPVLSPLNAILVPILFVFCEKAGLQFNALMRIRIGLFTRAMFQAPHHNPHVDLYEPHRVALYYVNDSDGDTVVFKETYDDVPKPHAARYANEGKFTVGEKISPKKGKMVSFDGKRYHASMHPLAHSSRIVVTFDFV